MFLKASTSSQVCITASNSPTLMTLVFILGTGHYLSPGGGGEGEFGAKQGEI